MPLNYDTVKSTEKKEEASPILSNSKFKKLPDFGGPTSKGIGRNFTCTACGEVLDEVVTTNGKVKGWCGVKHQLIGI